MTELLDMRVADLTFKARALAQAHPLSRTAALYREDMINGERETQPLPEFADWAATAFLVGYCIRRVEEADVGQIPEVLIERERSDFVSLGSTTGRFSEDVRNGRAAGTPMLEPQVVEALLNRVISTEVDKRADHWKSQITTQDWAQFEEYVAWWVIHGYSFRAAETVGANPGL